MTLMWAIAGIAVSGLRALGVGLCATEMIEGIACGNEEAGGPSIRSGELGLTHCTTIASHEEKLMDIGHSLSGKTVRTREALLLAFRDLLFERGYDKLGIRGLITRANIARSTFYEHFGSKDDLLRQSLRGPFSILADMRTPSYSAPLRELLVQHFWENRRLIQTMLRARLRYIVCDLLTDLIASRLGDEYVMPPHLLAAQLSQAQVGLIKAWLLGKRGCTASQVTGALHAGTTASAAALHATT